MPETKKNSKIEKIFIGVVEATKEMKTDLGEHKEWTIRIGQKKFDIEMKRNEDRDMWHPIITYNGRTHSLSFFRVKRDAEKNILRWIALSCGIVLPEGVGN